MISVADLIRHRMKHEKFIRRVAEGAIPTEFGEFRTIAYGSDLNPEYHLALVRGDVAGKETCWCACTRAAFSATCSAPPPASAARLVRNSLRAIAEEGEGVLVYLHETGPGFRIDRGAGTPRILGHGRDFMHYKGEAGQRQLQHEHGIGAQILSDLGLHTIRLLTNHPRKIVALEGFGIEVVDQIPVGHSDSRTGNSCARRAVEKCSRNPFGITVPPLSTSGTA
jgi:3,4-dihydroxy 2-butanone 4-phosphate synthase/GTP cyclohydrolase II